jgi:LuxR family maltose regulon positive regulatory protein
LLRSDEALTRPYPWLPPDLRAATAVPVPGTCGGGTPPPVEPLSEREHDVLARAAQMMSTAEIAADLYLSVNTVKTHLKSINRKLAADRRGEAVRRARQLNLL